MDIQTITYVLEALNVDPKTAATIVVFALFAYILGSVAAKIVRALGYDRLAGVIEGLTGDIGKILENIKKPAAKKPGASAASKVAGVSIVFAFLALPGCQAFAKVVDSAQDVCETKLAVLPEVIQEAAVRGVSVGQLTDAFCGFVDVAAVFTEKKPASGGPRLAAQKPEAQALALLRAKGEIE